MPATNWFTILFITVLISELTAQELITDRPDQSESAVTISPNALQIETGFAYEKLTENGVELENHNIAGTLFRYGMFNDIELRLGTAFLRTKAQNLVEGMGDFLAGTKINFLKEEIQGIDFAVLAHALLPFGSEEFNPIKVEPEVIAAVSKSINSNLSASLNFGGSWNSALDETFLIYSAALGLGIDEKFSTFIEIYGNIFSSFVPLHNFDGGITYLLSEDLQLDLSAGKELSGVDSFWFISTGFSVRFNNI